MSYTETYLTTFQGSRSPIDGFVNWAWDELEKTLHELHEEPEQVAENIAYVLEREASTNHVDREDLFEDALDFIEDNREELTHAIMLTLAEETK